MTTINLPSIVVTGGSSTVSPFTAISLANASVTAGNWGQTTPSTLSAVTDNDLASTTSWGQTAGAGNKGFIQVDIGQSYDHLFVEAKIGFRMGDGWGGGSAAWSIDVADDAGNFTPLWLLQNFKPGTTEFILRRGFWTSGQKIRFTAEDTANGPAMLRAYHFKAWSVTLP